MKKILLLTLLMCNTAFANNWECINKDGSFCDTWKMSVPNGWIIISEDRSINGYAMVFVPDPQHAWRI
jgi:hypothetical protein